MQRSIEGSNFSVSESEIHIDTSSEEENEQVTAEEPEDVVPQNVSIDFVEMEQQRRSMNRNAISPNDKRKQQVVISRQQQHPVEDENDDVDPIIIQKPVDVPAPAVVTIAKPKTVPATPKKRQTVVLSASRTQKQQQLAKQVPNITSPSASAISSATPAVKPMLLLSNNKRNTMITGGDIDLENPPVSEYYEDEIPKPKTKLQMVPVLTSVQYTRKEEQQQKQQQQKQPISEYYEDENEYDVPKPKVQTQIPRKKPDVISSAAATSSTVNKTTTMSISTTSKRHVNVIPPIPKDPGYNVILDDDDINSLQRCGNMDTPTSDTCYTQCYFMKHVICFLQAVVLLLIIIAHILTKTTPFLLSLSLILQVMVVVSIIFDFYVSDSGGDRTLDLNDQKFVDYLGLLNWHILTHCIVTTFNFIVSMLTILLYMRDTPVYFSQTVNDMNTAGQCIFWLLMCFGCVLLGLSSFFIFKLHKLSVYHNGLNILKMRKILITAKLKSNDVVVDVTCKDSPVK